MKILKVIHGYPPYYSAGSEVYSQTLAHELANNNEVQIFTLGMKTASYLISIIL